MLEIVVEEVMCCKVAFGPIYWKYMQFTSLGKVDEDLLMCVSYKNSGKSIFVHIEVVLGVKDGRVREIPSGRWSPEGTVLRPPHHWYERGYGQNRPARV